MARHTSQHNRANGRSLEGRVLLAAGLAWLVLPLDLGATHPELSPSVQESRPANGRPGPLGGRPPLPNVLVIVTDDQRDGTLGVMPKTREWLGAGGKKFVNAFATTPLCCPSRASIFTGRYAHNHSVTNNDNGNQLDHSLTMQRYLRDAGYLTAVLGKFLSGWDLHDNPPNFDRWAIQKDGYYDADFNVDGEIRAIPGYALSFIGTQAMRLIRFFEAEDEQPWFLYVAPYAPHASATPPPEYADAKTPRRHLNPAVRERNRRDKPRWVRTRAVGARGAFRKRQLRTLMAIDDLVNRIAEGLSRNREDRRTLVVFLSDNGYLWGEHGLTAKNHPYTPSVEVPLLLRWRGHVSPGTTSHRLAANVDVSPTILDAVGITPRVAMDGRSLLRPLDRDQILLEYWRENDRAWVRPWASIRTKRYQYVEHYAGGDRRVPIFREYYRLTRDPWQLRNLLHDGRPSNNPDVRRLHRALMRDSRCVGSGCP